MKAMCWMVAGVFLGCGLGAGCGRSGRGTSDFEKAIKSLPPPPSGQTQDPVKEAMSQALAAVQQQEYVQGAVSLQTLRSTPNLSGDQLTAVQDAMAALQMQLVEQAAAGDPKAQQALDVLRVMPRR